MREARGARRNRPAVDGERLASVRAEVGEHTLRRYTRAYLDLLLPRIERIEQAMAAAEAGEARRLLFDLRVSSEMLGVARLPGMIAELESSPQTWQPAGTSKLRRVRREARRVAGELTRFLDGDGLGRVGPR